MVDPKYDDDSDLSQTSRRGLLTAAAGIIGIGAAATVLGPVAIFLGHPLEHDTTSSSDAYLPAGPPSLFVGPAPVKVDLFADQVDAWNRVVKVKVGSAWVMRKGPELVAYSTVCPHLGCGIDFDGGANKFYCACHKSYFSLDGAVEDGPSPRAMDQLELEAAEQLVSIRYQRFKQGVEHKEPA
jgi:quinol---cytochrome c reductase iron-sulfur subunit, bacillus type